MLELSARLPFDSACQAHAALRARFGSEDDGSARAEVDVEDESTASERDLKVEQRAPAVPRLRAAVESDALGWMTRIQTGDQSALRLLHVAFQCRTFVCALAIVRRDEIAHEVVSVTFMQAWTTAADYDPLRGSVAAWLMLIARSRSLDALRRVRVQGSREVSVDEDDERQLEPAWQPGADPLAHLERKTRDIRLHRALMRLSPIQRQVLSLTALEGLSQDEASKHLDLPLGTVKSHARRGLTALRTRCEAFGLATV